MIAMQKRHLILISTFFFVFASACASGDPPSVTGDDDGGTLIDEDTGGGDDVAGDDVGQPDTGQSDTGKDVDKDTGPTFKPPEFYHSTSGGGLSTSPEFKLQMNFGAPMPRGTSSNGEYRLRFGPVSP
jgi:hypothetical protein